MSYWDNYYLIALEDVMYRGKAQHNKRTGQDVIAYPGLHMRLDLSAGFPALTARKIPLKLFVAEMVWFLSGYKSLVWLQNYTRVWDGFMETDGYLAAPYGWRWRKAFGRDQLKQAVRTLEKDPSSRQVVVLAWHPGRDGLTNQGLVKNVPCLTSWTANIIDGELNLGVEVRSNDMVLGCPHDVGGFSLLAYLLAAHLNVKVGILSYHVTHAHIYKSHLEAAKKLSSRIGREHKDLTLEVDKEWLGCCMTGDGKLMDSVVAGVLEQLEPQYSPAGSIGKLELHH